MIDSQQNNICQCYNNHNLVTLLDYNYNLSHHSCATFYITYISCALFISVVLTSIKATIIILQLDKWLVTFVEAKRLFSPNYNLTQYFQVKIYNYCLGDIS